MFEIGSALREARERRGLSYSQVEEGTKIRARYIRALEDEDFGVLPGATYSKGFLRAYADYLGLDGHLFIDEFNSRYHDPRNDDDRPIYPPSRRTPPRDQHRPDRAGGDRCDRLAGVPRRRVGRHPQHAAADAVDDDAQPQDHAGFDRVDRWLVAGRHHELEQAQAGYGQDVQDHHHRRKRRLLPVGAPGIGSRHRGEDDPPLRSLRLP